MNGQSCLSVFLVCYNSDWRECTQVFLTVDDTWGNQRGMRTSSALHACGSQSEQSPQRCL
jgi:hypothetical protein